MNCYNILICLPQNCAPQFEENFTNSIKNIVGNNLSGLTVIHTALDYGKKMRESSYNLVIAVDDICSKDSYVHHIFEGPGCSEVNYVIVVSNECCGSEHLKELYNKGLYNALYEKDTDFQMLSELIFHPRKRADAEIYYGLYHADVYVDVVEKSVSQQQSQIKPQMPKEQEEYGVRKKLADGFYVTRVRSLDVRKLFRKNIEDDSVVKAFIADMSNLDEVLAAKSMGLMEPYEFELEPKWIQTYVLELKKYFQGQGSYFFQSYENGKLSKEDFADSIKNHLDSYELDNKKKELVYEAFVRDIDSYGKLDVIINKPDVTDIRLLRKDVVTMQYKGKWYHTNITFATDEEYEYFINRICTKNHVSVNIQEPEIIFSDPDTFENAKLRITVSHDMINSNNAMSMHVRKIDKIKKTTEQLISEGFFTRKQAAFLIQIMKQKKSVIVVGPSGSGKTICINWMLEFADAGICGVCVQEADELHADTKINMDFKHSINAKGESKVSHTLRDLATFALLRNTQLFVIGEIKGDEARDYMTASLSTQTISSTHGESEFEALPRIVDLAKYKSDYSENDLLKRLARNSDYVVFKENYISMRIAGVVGWDDERQDVIYDLYDFEGEQVK